MPDRDIRGTYKKFSQTVTRASYQERYENDRSQVNVNPQRRNFAVEAKELAKTKSLNSALKNINDYLIMIDRSRKTLQSVHKKLLLLEDTINESAGILDVDDYVVKNVGAIANAEITGEAAVAGTFSNIPASSTSGVGVGASFTIVANGSGKYVIENINSEGRDFKVEDTITINGNLLGGQQTRNNALITVKELSSFAERVLQNEIGEKIKFATDDIERKSLPAR